MSPEQATGDLSVGAATDVYAVGCVLYEMLVGEPPYTGSTAQAILGKIIAGKLASATEERASVPANVDAAIRKALEKVPADRFAGAADLAKALADSGFRHGTVTGVVAATTAPGHWRAATLVASSLAVLFAGVALQSRSRPEPIRNVERFAAPFLEGQEPLAIRGEAFDLAPDGTLLVYRTIARATSELAVRRWDELTATPVRESSGALYPTVSPDGLEVAFQQGGQIKALAFSGGPVRTLTEGSFPKWGPDGFVYATTDSGAVRVPSAGGAVEYLSRLEEGDGEHVVYEVLPGGRSALLTASPMSERAEIRALDLRSGEMTRIVDGDWPLYTPSGHLVYGVDCESDFCGTMMAARFDLGKMELLGTPVAIMDGLTAWSLAHDGKLFYSQGAANSGAGPTIQLTWVTRDGRATPVDPNWTFGRGGDVNQGWRISPDGSQVALREATEEGYDIWIKQLDRGPRSRLTFGDAHDRMPVWEPGGREVTFLSDRGGNLDVWSKPADGTGEARLLVDLDANLATVDWSPDGEWLLLRTSAGSEGASARDILALRPGVDSAAAALLTSEYREIDPAVSPDGRWIAYASDETGRYEVYVRPFPEVATGRWQLSIDGGRAPHWSRDGGEIFFQGPEQEMMVAAVDNSSSFRVAPPELLFESDPSWLFSNFGGLFYDVAPDDQRFLVGARVTGVEAAERNAPDVPRVVLVNNFMEILKVRVPN